MGLGYPGGSAAKGGRCFAAVKMIISGSRRLLKTLTPEQFRDLMAFPLTEP